jgi:glycine dehydrogenase subunit 1
MRYLPLTQSDRSAMLSVIGAKTIDDLFADVPTEARLSGPIAGLPSHASEMAVERHMSALARQNMAAVAARTSTTSPRASIISSSAENF